MVCCGTRTLEPSKKMPLFLLAYSSTNQTLHWRYDQMQMFMKMIANRKCHTYASPQRTFTLFAGFNAKRTKRPFTYQKKTQLKWNKPTETIMMFHFKCVNLFGNARDISRPPLHAKVIQLWVPGPAWLWKIKNKYLVIFKWFLSDFGAKKRKIKQKGKKWN